MTLNVALLFASAINAASATLNMPLFASTKATYELKVSGHQHILANSMAENDPAEHFLLKKKQRNSSVRAKAKTPVVSRTRGDKNLQKGNAKNTSLIQIASGWPFGEDRGKVNKAAKCGVPIFADKTHSKEERCPEDCPYYVQDKTDDKHCTFACVKEEECVKFNPNAHIADDDRHICRGPMVNHCREYDMTKKDQCAVCQRLYQLESDGQCYPRYKWALYTFVAVAICVVLFLVYWIVNLSMRENVNPDTLQHALECRERSKLKMPKQDGRKRKVWDVDTNLLTTQVAGPGMMLHFNFQFVMIVWPILVGLGWVILASVVDGDLFILGTRKFGTPRENCILVSWGWSTQQRLMWTKILFLGVVYLTSFLLALLHSVRQLRIYQSLDVKEKTMKDFAALADGLPLAAGTDLVEDELKQVFLTATGQKLVGVSVCWDYKEHQDEVMKFISKSLDAKDPLVNSKKGSAESDKANLGRLGRKLYEMEQYIFEEEEADEKPDAETEVKEMKELLQNMKSTDQAFFVFETQAACEAAVKEVKSRDGLKFGNGVITLSLMNNEPNTVQWWNFGHATFWEKFHRLCIGFGCIFLGLLTWTILFYAPYAWSIMHFNYDNGQQPGIIYSIAFSMVVVIGNNIMYEVCARVSDFVGFRFKDDKEACYMILYTIACTFNILLDTVTTYFMSWEIMKGLGFRTWDGRKLHEVTGFQDRFETYAMQRMLAENTFLYAFPSTFLVPFVIEPFLTIAIPLRLGVLIVRTHSRIQGHAAEDWIASIPFEMGRYADIILNVVLGILIFFFPGGYTYTLFFAMAASHVFIYVFDHIRVLKVIPACTFATMGVDWWAQAMLAPCCGLILSALIFKANGRGYGFDLERLEVPFYCTLAFAAHCLVHILLLCWVVPLFGLKDQEDIAADITFKDVATKNACSWFTANPVHCLRSLLIYEHKVPCTFWVNGREHLLDVNEQIGCYFKDEAAEVDCTGAWEHMKSLSKESWAKMSWRKKSTGADPHAADIETTASSSK